MWSRSSANWKGNIFCYNPQQQPNFSQPANQETMPETFCNPEEVKDPGTLQSGELLLQHATSPKEIIVAIRHWVLMRQDIGSGKSFVHSLDKVYPKSAPDPKTLYEWAVNSGREDLALRLWAHFQLVTVLDQQVCNAIDYLVDLGLQKFSTSEPSAEEIGLLKTLVPQISEQVAVLQLR